MTATVALTSETVVTRQDIFFEILNCPAGLGFAAGSLVHSLSDCKCAHGTEPAGESGLGSGCTQCPRGKHKSTVADVSCSSCSGLTTLQEGTIFSAACTCPAGFVNEVHDDPTNCQPCGKGFYCKGGTHKAACGQSLSTATETAAGAAECICAAGFFRSESACEPCPRGRFKSDLGTVACHPCPAGTWSNESAASHEDACNSCMEGSTTLEDGAEDMSFCIRPEPGQHVQCPSGRVCIVEIMGFQLQDGHRLVLTESSCGGGIAAVSGVVAQGISDPATNTGSRYVWGESGNEFIPQGGLYNLCWCANLRHLRCESLRDNFVLSAGQLEVIGPLSNHSFECVRGWDCSGLAVFRGHSLSSQNQVAIRNACGGAEPMSVASTNPDGTGTLSISDGKVLLDADTGYAICCCGQSCLAATDFSVPAGHLRVIGPYTNQEATCFLGQQCRLQSIKGVGLMVGDQIMLRTDCNTGPMLPGSPGDGAASSNEAWIAIEGRTGSALRVVNCYQDDGDFVFAGDPTLKSTAGIFTMCFCRPGICAISSDFKASIGFFTARGPFPVKTACLHGQECRWPLLGIGLNVGDRLVFRKHGCQDWNDEKLAVSTEFQLFMQIPEPLEAKDVGNGLEVDLGTLPFEGQPGPGVYQICWCPSELDCASADEFRASAGDLQIEYATPTTS
eukprot:Skav207543  [mRNA]  locus=scaffold2063:30905:33294:+ [translate_table: standard]